MDSNDGYQVTRRRINITGNQERRAPMKNSLLALMLVSFLSACGGGGGGTAPADPPGTGVVAVAAQGPVVVVAAVGRQDLRLRNTVTQHSYSILAPSVPATAMLNPWQRVALIHGLTSSSPCPSVCTNPLFGVMPQSTASTIKTVRFP